MTRIWTLTTEGMEVDLNKAKDITVAFLHESGLLADGVDIDNIRRTVMISLRTPTSISTLYRKVLGKSSNDVKIIISKVDDLAPPDTAE